jgi:hypothetical protein
MKRKSSWKAKKARLFLTDAKLIVNVDATSAGMHGEERENEEVVLEVPSKQLNIKWFIIRICIY